MDLIKTLMVYMMLLVGSSTEGAPAVTPVPATPAPLPTAAVIVSTAAPSAPTATPGVRYGTIYVGDKGENVRRLQKRLNELGYYKGKIDGQYGQQTRRAVEEFQRQTELKADGIAGRITQAACLTKTPPRPGPPPRPRLRRS